MPPKMKKVKDYNDNKNFSTFRKMITLVEWHPRISNNELPLWLADYEVLHFKSPDRTSDSDAVHRLFFTSFEDMNDHTTIVPAISKGETFAVFTPDRRKAVSPPRH